MDSPLKFLQNYEKGDISFFFGRENETKELFERIKHQKLIVLFGLSGTGKTSLIKCGLANMYNEMDWSDLYIRRKKDFSLALEESLWEAGNGTVKMTDSVTQALEKIYLSEFKPIYLIFDQFEEIFISGKEEERESFRSILKEILEKGSNTKVLIVLREEYLGRLDFFERKISDFGSGRVRMRLEKMGEEKTISLIRDIFKVIHSNYTIDETIIRCMYEKIKDGQGFGHLPYLQILMKKIADSVNFDDKEIETKISEIVKGTEYGEIVNVYLEEKVKEIGNETGSEAEVWEFLQNNFVTVEGTKKIYYPKNEQN